MADRLFRCSLSFAMLVAVVGCSTVPQTPQAAAALQKSTTDALTLAKQKDPSLNLVLRRSAGYAVFPAVGTLSVGVSGTYGQGDVYERGRLVGYSDVTQGSLSLQLSAQSYAEIICFATHDALLQFQKGQFTPQAAAVPINSGAASHAKYPHGFAVFTMDPQGQSLTAPIGGQKFSYQKKP
jgi:lipid-binding SYLF domain-containing protein